MKFQITKVIEYVCEVEAECEAQAKQIALRAPCSGGADWEEFNLKFDVVELNENGSIKC
jgi:hypothetical protein